MRLTKTIALVALALITGSAYAQKTEVLWLGHAAFRIVSPGGKVIVVDPALTVMPSTPPQYRNLEAIGKVDLLLLTHGHWDHSTDAPALAKLNGIPLHSPGDLNNTLMTLGVLPGKQLPRANKSGRITPVPGIKVTYVRAEHSSIYVWKNPATGRDETHPGGEAVGYIIEMENGFRIWHMGDTGIFGDMKLIAEYYKPDLVLLPIGGGFTMDAADAAFVLREMIKPKYAMPMHYRVSPGQQTPPEQLVEALGKSATQLILLKPGEAVNF